MLRKFSEEPSVIRKDFFIVSVLVFNAFVWFYMTVAIIDRVLSTLSVTSKQNFIIWATYFLAIVISGIVGSILSSKISRLKLLYFWVILGVVTSPSLALLGNFTVTHVLVASILLGVSFGLGMPSCLALFADCTLIENRGRTSGIILLITNLIAPLFGISFVMSSLIVNSIIFTLWRATGLIIFFFGSVEKGTSENRKRVSFASILFNKSFMLYFVAWLMFCLIDRFEQPILKNFFGDFHFFIVTIGPLIASFSALIAGLLSDEIGRKLVVLCGFATLGIGYGIIGLAPATMISWYFFLIVGSISTGILWVTFWLILWGDLSRSGAGEKYYAIGEAPYFFTFIIRVLPAPQVTMIPATSAFSLASFFLFLAVLPLLYAPETLPQKKIELRRLRKYVETAKKLEEKYMKKAVKG